MSRQLLEEVLKLYGAKVVKSVSKNTDLLIAGDNPSPGKIRKAQELNIPIFYLKATELYPVLTKARSL